MAAKTVSWTRFHRPQWNAAVVRRRLSEELLEVLYVYGEVAARRYRAVFSAPKERSRKAVWQAAARLRARGLAVTYRGRLGEPVLTVSRTWNPPETLRPERLWNQKWNGIWFVLMYDVAEADRRHRDALRFWLKRLRLGCLQKSVWITPWDIRADYADLAKVTGLGLSSYLVEARAALGHTDADMVDQAWDWDTLHRQQTWYAEGVRPLLTDVKAGRWSEEELGILAREELAAFRAAMEGDPMLPRALHSGRYLGIEVVSLHENWVAQVRKACGGL